MVRPRDGPIGPCRRSAQPAGWNGQLTCPSVPRTILGAWQKANQGQKEATQGVSLKRQRGQRRGGGGGVVDRGELGLEAGQHRGQGWACGDVGAVG